MHKGVKKFEDEKYAKAQIVTTTSPLTTPLDEDQTLYELPAVLRMGSGVWGLYMITIRGSRVVDKQKLHGPDVRRVCLAKAVRILER